MFFSRKTKKKKYDLDKVMSNLSSQIKSISNFGMKEFMNEVIKKDEAAKKVEEKALEKACITFNTVFAVLKIKSSSLDYDIKNKAVDYLKHNFWYDLPPSFGSSPYLDRAREAREKLKEPAGGLEYGLMISDLFFSIYNDFVESKNNKTKTIYEKKVCEPCGLKKVHSLALNFTVNEALITGVSDIEKITGLSILMASGEI